MKSLFLYYLIYDVGMQYVASWMNTYEVFGGLQRYIWMKLTLVKNLKGLERYTTFQLKFVPP
jgi:hypothetical protein